MENNTSIEHVEAKNTRYQYFHVDMETVISNPDEYIIPACQPACQALWDKNIETFIVSNDDDKSLYVLLGELDDLNQKIIKEVMENDSRYFFSEFRKTFGIRVSGGMDDLEAIKELEDLTNIFEMQDTFRFKSPEAFLKDFKSSFSNIYEVQEDGTLLIKENPELSHLSFEEALAMSGKKELYIKEEERVYDSTMYLNWHKRYQEYLMNKDEVLKKR